MYQATKKGGANIENKSRADYFKERRKGKKQFNVTLDREKIEALERTLEKQEKTKTLWLEEKIDEELRK